MELDPKNLQEARDLALAKSQNRALTKEERDAALREFEVISRILDKEIELSFKSDERDLQLDKLDAEVEKTRIEAKAKRFENLLRFGGDVIKGGCQVFTGIIGGAVTINIARGILDGEMDGRLIVTKLWGMLPKWKF